MRSSGRFIEVIMKHKSRLSRFIHRKKRKKSDEEYSASAALGAMPDEMFRC